jgi:hypothetical protein
MTQNDVGARPPLASRSARHQFRTLALNRIQGRLGDRRRRAARFQHRPQLTGFGIESAAIARGGIPSANLPNISSTMNASRRSIFPSR